jgi:polyisoprenoid-binding protein YceI
MAPPLRNECIVSISGAPARRADVLPLKSTGVRNVPTNSNRLHRVLRAPTEIMNLTSVLAVATAAAFAFPVAAAPVTYKVDPDHTYPSFEADHMGISVWRGKMNKTEGSVIYDKADGSGSVEVKIDMASIDFGQRQLSAWARSKEFFDIDSHPYATFKGRFAEIVNRTPSKLDGELTLNGITKPVTLKINSLKCIAHPIFKRELCGADAVGTFNRDEFGLSAGKEYGFKMDVALRIQVEALQVP